MRCRDLYGFLDEFLDQRLDMTTRLNFERHLERCAACRRYLTTYETTLRVARGAEHTDEPANLEAPAGLIQAIIAARGAAFVRQPPE
jgi:anti-sigma factor RsiW